MTDISTSLPTVHSAGDTLDFKRYYSDYLPATWTLTFYLVNSAGQITFSASDNGDGWHLVDVAAATTASWAAGNYSLHGFVSDGTDRYQVEDSRIEILPDFATQTAGYDDRSHACTMVDLLESLMQSGATGEKSVSFNGRSVTYKDDAEITADYFKWKDICKQEQAAEKINNGLASGYKIKTRLFR